MRGVTFCLALLCLADAAVAADLDESFIRGSDVYQPQAPTYRKWEGFYGGGQVGYATANADLTNGVKAQLDFITRDMAELGNGQVSSFPMFSTQDTQSRSYGFFVGYNSQWDQVVLGVELNYNRTSLQASQSSTFSRIISPGDGFNYHTTVDALAFQRITDYGTLRARAGYVMEGFMPYATVGVAVGRVDINRTASVRSDRFLTMSDPVTGAPTDVFIAHMLLQPSVDSEVRTKFIYGYAAGVGLEAAILPNVFVRGEYEFLQFGPFSDMRANINAIRLGGGVRF